MKRLVLVAALLVVLGAAVEARAEPTGSALPGLESYDEMMAALIKKWDVPGAALAVAHHGKLVLVRGYGLANKERSLPVEPTSLFRLASLSKTVTAVAVLQLVQGGRLKLDDKVVPILGDIGPRADRITDSRVHDITVRYLLQHSGGFDRNRSGDVVFMPGAADAAQRQGGPLPPDCPTIMRDTLERKLDFAPGERFAYSNIGYCILGRVVERVTGVTYETHVRRHVLGPVGATRMTIGHTLRPADGEVTYYDYRGAKEVKAMPGLGLKIAPQPYGAFALETMDSYGTAPTCSTPARCPGQTRWLFARPTGSPGSSRSTAGRRIVVVSEVRPTGACGSPRARCSDGRMAICSDRTSEESWLTSRSH